MKFLLTSAGIKNTSIHNALVNLLGKPISESNALCIPTAIYPFSVGPSMAYRFISGLGQPPDRIGLEVVGRAGAHRAAQYQERELGRSRRGG